MEQVLAPEGTLNTLNFNEKKKNDEEKKGKEEECCHFMKKKNDEEKKGKEEECCHFMEIFLFFFFFSYIKFKASYSRYRSNLNNQINKTKRKCGLRTDVHFRHMIGL